MISNFMLPFGLAAIDMFEILVYGGPLGLILAIYLFIRHRKHQKNLAILQENQEAGLTEPVSLHPVINPNRCIGVGACVSACPEKKVIGLIDSKAHLINPTSCIGHGACKEACPMDAITLVFGTERRGVEIPIVKPNFETTIPGIFIAGELGGMGLIRNAITQGRQAMDAIADLDGIGRGDRLDVLIVGAGPAGFSASLAALEKKLRYVTLEQESLGGAVFQYPRGKIVMTAPVDLPIVGQVKMTETSKEALLDFWKKIEKQTGVVINYYERMEKITQTEEGDFIVQSSQGTYRTRAILLTIGRRGTPRKLGVPGEDLPKVVYRMIDPEQYQGQKVLVVGGGDSALEAATSIAEEPDTTVTLSYRSGAFTRARKRNREKLRRLESQGKVQVLMKSQVKAIEADKVQIEHEGKLLELDNDAVIICAGGVLPTGLLKEIGIEVETKYGTP